MVFHDPQRTVRIMEEAGLEALVATTPPNVQYLTGFRKPGGTLAVVSRNTPDRPALIVPTSSVDFVLDDPSDDVDVLVHGRFIRDVAADGQLTAGEARVADLHRSARTDVDAWGLLAEHLQGVDLGEAALGVDNFPGYQAALTAGMPAARLEDATAIFTRLRSVKTPEEIARLAEAARITEHAIFRSAGEAALGTTQLQLARAFRLAVAECDALLRSDNVSIDGGSALGNVNIPSDVVSDGSVIRYDVGVFVDGYASDISRCFAFREASAKTATYHRALVEGQERALTSLRAGVKASEVFEVAVSAVRDAGIPHYARTHVGHGIGIAGAGYDAPLLAPGDYTVLEAGMVLCVETPYYELGFAGLQVEDMVVVEEHGYRPLNHTRRELQVIP